ncbi:hypothetical protein KW782_04640 [Candidatus Parcubacteria bacterium]|nr:hypothetical protein [Candidatus Parcubacteria bacterium]
MASFDETGRARIKAFKLGLEKLCIVKQIGYKQDPRNPNNYWVSVIVSEKPKPGQIPEWIDNVRVVIKIRDTPSSPHTPNGKEK